MTAKLEAGTIQKIKTAEITEGPVYLQVGITAGHGFVANTQQPMVLASVL